MYIDSHAHYDSPVYDNDRDRLFKSFRDGGIDAVINAASDMNASYKGIELADKYNFLFAAVGVHPHEVKDMQEDNIEELKQLSQNKKAVAIGEIGLDYYYDHSPRDKQLYWFNRQLELAAEVDLPVIIHSRDAAGECYEIIKKHYKSSKGKLRGVIHCYSGSVEMALDYVKMGFYIGVGGVVTFKNAKTLPEVVKTVPLDRILLETDAPYLSPEPVRGKKNDSLNLGYIAHKISNITEIPLNEVAKCTSCNVMSLFDLRLGIA